MSWLLMVPLMFVLWLVQRTYQNAVLADLGFCFGFGVIVLWYAGVVEGHPFRRMAVGTMGGVYALRLGLHLFFNRIYGKTEDARYQRLRTQWGDLAQLNFLLYFQGQAVAVAVFSIPTLVLMASAKPPFSPWEILGMVVWVMAVGGEALADMQLTRFRAQPINRHKTFRGGFWRYSRHPNYFFESLHWCSYVIMAVGIPNAWLTLIGPVLMIWGLVKVTGIPFAEAQALATRGDDYRDYQRTTKAFIPWFPKKS